MVSYVLNFGHRLSQRALAHLAPCREIQCRFDVNLREDTRAQVVHLVNEAERLLEKEGGRLDGSQPLYVNLPGLSEFSVALVAEIHGRIGGFPRVLALRRDSVTGLWNLFADSGNLGVIDLERVRQESRGRRRVESAA